MNERHPVEKSPPYHVVIWIVAGLVAVAIVYGLVQRANLPPAQPPAKPPRAAGGDEQLPTPPRIPFTDITTQAGIAFSQFGGAMGEKLLPESGGSGCAWIDYDNDGDPDLLLISGRRWEWTALEGRERPNSLALYRNDQGKFTDVTEVAGLLNTNFYGQGAAVGDFDADGDDDLVVTALGGIYVYRNDGGKFTDVSAESGAKVDAADWPTSAGFFDCDRDGDLDLFVVNYVRWTREADQKAERRVPGVSRSYAHPDGFEGTHNFLFRNDGGHFTNVSAAAGIQVNDKKTGKPLGKGLALTFVDFDRDGWLDVFVSNDTVPHFLFRNKGNGTFEDVAADRHVALNSDGAATSGMSADSAWLRNNDELTIAVGNFADERTSFFVSGRDGERVTFADESLESGIGSATREMLTWGLLFDDFDLDRRVDMVQTNGHLEETIHEVQPSQTYAQRAQLFWNTVSVGPRILVDLPAANIGDLAKPLVGRALSSADIDGDGDLDLVITSVGGPPRLLRNDQKTGNHWLRVQLVGPAGNRHGIGATIELKTAGVTQRRTVMPTRSYLTQTEPMVTFGLGNSTEVESLNITWSDGVEQTVIVKGVDRVLKVEQDKQTFAVLTNIAKAHYENGADYAKAVAAIERALKLKPDSLAMRRNLARARFLFGQYAQSIDELRAIDAKTPSAATAYLMGLAAAHLAATKQLPWNEVVEHLRRAVELDPNDAALRYQLGNALFEAGDVAASDEQFNKTIELDPLHGQASNRLAIRIRPRGPEEQRDPDKQNLYRQLIRNHQRALVLRGDKEGKIDPASLEVCKYTRFELPDREMPEAAPEVTASKFAVADLILTSAGNAADRLPQLAGVAPLFLEENGRYQLVGVSPAGELVLIAFDDEGRPKVVARGEQPIGAVGKDAIVLVCNTIRDSVDRLPGGAPDEPATREGDRPEIAIVTPERTWLVRYQTTKGFSDLTADSQLSAAAGDVARWIDMDRDGDIDLCVGSAKGFQVWRNNGDGTFTEKTAEFALTDAGPTVDMGAADFTGLNTRTDLVLAGPRATSLWKAEMRGEFVQDAETAARWPAAQRVVVDDFNNDSLPDVVFVSPNMVTLDITKGEKQQPITTNIETIDAAIAIDDDNDGRLDIAVFGRSGGERKAVLLRNTGGRFAETAQPLPLAAPRRNGILALDFDGDCDTDLLAIDEQGQLRGLRNESAAGNRQLKMSLYSNEWDPSPIGTRVEVRRDDFAASRWTQQELPIEIGVGSRTRVDTVQTLWTNGIAKNEIGVDVDCKPLRITIIEFKRTTSCPFLYAWIDGQWQFITDLLGVAPLNVAVARGVQMPPDPDEVAVLGPAERFADGPVAARLRISTELREITYLNQLRLLAVDHASDVSIFSRDRVAPTPTGGKQIIAGRNQVGLRSAVGSDGLDRTAALLKEDEVYADPGQLIPAPAVGFTKPLSIEFEFDDPGDTSNLFMALTGWFRFGSSSSNIAASQRGDLQVIWPRLEVRSAAGEWQLVEEIVGLPAGNTKTIVCELAGKLPPGARRFRLTSSFEVRWDRVALYHAVAADELRVSEAAPSVANLAWHGFHDFVVAASDQPKRPDLARRNGSPPWFTSIEGWCTRYGDIRSLIDAADEKSAVINAGDGATIEFPAAALPPRAGTARTLLVYSVGGVKSADANDTSPLTVVPFPGSDATVDQAQGGDWQLEYNSRWVPRNRFAPAALK